MSANTPPGGRDAQLVLFKSLSAILAILLLAGAGFYFYRQHQGQPVSILVNGQPVATVESAADADALIARVTLEKAGSAGAAAKPQRRESVQLVRVTNPSVALDSDDTALQKLSAAIHVTVAAYLITVDGKPMVALPTKEAAQAALDALRKHYSDMPPPDAVLGEPTFREDVEISHKRIPAGLLKEDADSAVAVLDTPPPAKTYTVELHDTGWSIARKFHMNFTDFLDSNSGFDINKLHPGDTVNVSKTTPPVTVIVVKESSKQQPIRKDAPADAAGLRQETIDTTYVNGTAVGPGNATSIVTLRRAKPQRFVD